MNTETPESTGSSTLPGLPFLKMQAHGNDFVIIDCRDDDAGPFDADWVRAVSDRHRGVGFDQMAVLRDPGDSRDPGRPAADVRVDFRNADGSVSATCGNATRCIGRAMIEETGRRQVYVETAHDLLAVRAVDDRTYAVNMGHPRLTWPEIPLAREVDPLALPIEGSPVAVGMGNPHCVFLVEDTELPDPAVRGPSIESHPLFPERTNVEFVRVLDRETLRVRIWERGTGVTLASGSGSCAAAVAAHLRGQTGRRVQVHLDGGMMVIDWQADGIWMEGEARVVFSGILEPEFLELRP